MREIVLGCDRANLKEKKILLLHYDVGAGVSDHVRVYSIQNNDDFTSVTCTISKSLRFDFVDDFGKRSMLAVSTDPGR